MHNSLHHLPRSYEAAAPAHWPAQACRQQRAPPPPPLPARTWWPRPRLPLWIMTTTCPTWSIPILRAASRSNTSSTTWISA